MASYSVFDTLLPSDYGSFSQSQTLDIGIQFKITGDGCALAGYYWYLPAGADSTGADYSFRLYSTTTGASGTLITGSTVTGSGTWAGNTWNYTPLSSQVALTNGTTYVAVISMPATLLPGESNSNFWTTGGAGVAGLTTGPIAAPSTTGALGNHQQPFNQPSTGGFPVSSTNAWYGIDVNIARTATTPLGAPTGGPWSLAFQDDFDTPYPTKYGGTGPNPAVWADAAVNGLRIATAADSLEWAVRGFYACSVAGSILTITARFENPMTIDPTCANPMVPGGNTGKYTSAYASSHPGFAFTYGYVEALIRNTDSGAASGTWPAFWMMPSGGPQIPPEIDIDEFDPPGQVGLTHAGYDNTAGTFTNHYGTSALALGWHVYGMRLDSAFVTFFVDGVQVFQTAYDGIAYAWAIEFDNAVHNNLTGAGFPQAFSIDYVRAWTVQGVPAQPAIIGLAPSTGNPTAGQVVVSFGLVSGATSYRVTACITDQWDFNGSTGSTTAVTATGASSPITVTGLSNATPYHFTVAAINATGYSIESLPVPSLGAGGGLFGPFRTWQPAPGGWYAPRNLRAGTSW